MVARFGRAAFFYGKWMNTANQKEIAAMLRKACLSAYRKCAILQAGF